MATTPLIKTPQADGGTFYTFSSAARDLSKTLNNENIYIQKFISYNFFLHIVSINNWLHS